MSNSEENVFIDALISLIKGTQIQLYSGNTITLESIYFARKPAQVFDDTNVVVVPRGPNFDISILGNGADYNSTDRIVAIELYVFHDGIDEELVLRNLSNITFHITKLIMANRRLGGANMVRLITTEYDWSSAEDADNPGNVLSAISVARIPIVATYRRF